MNGGQRPKGSTKNAQDLQLTGALFRVLLDQCSPPKLRPITILVPNGFFQYSPKMPCIYTLIYTQLHTRYIYKLTMDVPSELNLHVPWFPSYVWWQQGYGYQGALIEAQALTLNLAGWIQAVKIWGKIDRKSINPSLRTGLDNFHPFLSD